MTDAIASASAPAAPASNVAPTSTSSGALAPVAPSTATTAPASVDAGAQSAMAQALVANGTWTQGQADKALADAGTAGEQPDPDQVAADGAMATALGNQQALADLGAALAADGVQTNEAGGVAYLVKQGLQRAPTFEQRTAECAGTSALLESMHGKEKAGWVMQWATQEFDRMAASNPKLRDLAERSGAGNNVSLINALAARGWQRHVDATIGPRK
jgi:hypothetical protein